MYKRQLLALAAASAAAVYTLIGRIQRGHLSTTVYTFLTFLTYLACFLTLLLGTAAAGTPLTGYGGREWLIGLALAVLCTLLGLSLIHIFIFMQITVKTDISAKSKNAAERRSQITTQRSGCDLGRRSSKINAL